jgi:acetyl esterase/lipase
MIITVIQFVAAIAGLITLALSSVLFFAFRWPAAAMWGLKVVVSALSVILCFISLLTFITGLLTGSFFIAAVGFAGMIIYANHIFLVSQPPARFRFTLPAVPEPEMEKDIVFATVPGIHKQLLCDVWQPAAGAPRSGQAFIYIHGSAFYFLDKDFGTRPLFKQLAARGHVIMDVAHRLAPDTDILGMIHDVKRAIDWMKNNADHYRISPDRIVIAGASSGGHLALMAGYTIGDDRFTPTDLMNSDFSVCSVVALYPPADLTDLYYHTNQHLTTRLTPGQPKPKVPKDIPSWIKKSLGTDLHRLGMDKNLENAGTMAPLMGGHPDEIPERYALFSPIKHVRPDCPPTLLIHGLHDIMTPVKATRELYKELIKNKVAAELHLFPQTDHAFDLVFTNISPAAHTAYYQVRKFLETTGKEIRPKPKIYSKKQIEAFAD